MKILLFLTRNKSLHSYFTTLGSNLKSRGYTITQIPNIQKTIKQNISYADLSLLLSIIFYIYKRTLTT